jgi:hypothetical protein
LLPLIAAPAAAAAAAAAGGAYLVTAKPHEQQQRSAARDELCSEVEQQWHPQVDSLQQQQHDIDCRFCKVLCCAALNYRMSCRVLALTEPTEPDKPPGVNSQLQFATASQLGVLAVATAAPQLTDILSKATCLQM